MNMRAAGILNSDIPVVRETTCCPMIGWCLYVVEGGHSFFSIKLQNRLLPSSLSLSTWQVHQCLGEGLLSYTVDMCDIAIARVCQTPCRNPDSNLGKFLRHSIFKKKIHECMSLLYFLFRLSPLKGLA